MIQATPGPGRHGLGGNGHGGKPGRDRHGELEGVRGKVVEICYDCFGDFAGFVLGCCEGDTVFETCERGIEAVLLRAMQDHAVLEVLVARETRRIARLVRRC